MKLVNLFRTQFTMLTVTISDISDIGLFKENSKILIRSHRFLFSFFLYVLFVKLTTFFQRKWIF